MARTSEIRIEWNETTAREQNSWVGLDTRNGEAGGGG